MLLIPSIDLKGGKCALPKAGAHKKAGMQADDPLAVAHKWVDAGARRLHVVDLDGQSSGKAAHSAVVKKLAEEFPQIPIQVSGGMRSEETVAAYIDAGASYVVLGTRAAIAPHFVNNLCLEYPGHIIVGLDGKGGKVAAEGWSKLADNDVQEAAAHFQREGAAAIVYAELGAGGVVNGACVQAAAELARAIAIPVIAAAGVVSLADVRALCGGNGEGLLGAIVGEALYDGGLDLGAAQKLADTLAKAT
jgi:phosphoribosylformimino-5-aminoimidazole carboxamide ribotide isomerase